MNTLRQMLVDESDVSSELDAEIRGALCECFPVDAGVFGKTRAWHGSAPAFSSILCCDRAVVAHVGLVDRTIRAGEKASCRVAGVQNVMVLPRYRGQGLSQHVMRAAMDEARRRGYDFGLLFCVPELARVYTACDWRNLGNREVIRVENGAEIPIPGKNIAMAHPLVARQFPEGVIHLQGNDW